MLKTNLYHTNNIPICLISAIRLFTDDTIVYLAIEYTIDTKHLQQALDKLAKWEGKWNMAFHLSLKINIQSNLHTPSMVLHNK
jgi:hypothetical protein